MGSGRRESPVQPPAHGVDDGPRAAQPRLHVDPGRPASRGVERGDRPHRLDHRREPDGGGAGVRIRLGQEKREGVVREDNPFRPLPLRRSG